ncbi:hypothetical protein D3C81_1810270 [compost metagenome]
MGQQALPRLGQARAAGMARDQGQRLFRLQFAQCLGHGGLGQVQRPRGGADPAFIGQRQQRLQLVQLHTPS